MWSSKKAKKKAAKEAVKQKEQEELKCKEVVCTNYKSCVARTRIHELRGDNKNNGFSIIINDIRPYASNYLYIKSAKEARDLADKLIEMAEALE